MEQRYHQHTNPVAIYIAAAVARAQYEKLPDDGTIYGEIPGFQGVWANAETREACEAELTTALDGWIHLRLDRHWAVPVVDGIDLSHGLLA
jgi:predicted RNase H-like HicB family nuclease